MVLRDVVARGIREKPRDGGVTPGGVLAYGDAGRHVETLPFGCSHVEPADQSFPVRHDTIYDVASVTKPVATAGALMKLGVDLDAPVKPLLPELTIAGAERITFAHLLGHASGFPAHLKFYERLLDGERLGATTPREALLRMVCTTELCHETGTRALYSDLGYIALGFAIERITGKRLDDAVRELVCGPLEMNDTFYVDLASGTATGGASIPVARIAPTEICPYRGLVRGAVHDDNAHAGGGIFGHAGLFATAGDLGRFARAILAALAGRSGHFDPAVVRAFTSRSSAPGTTWRCGWDRPSPLPAISHAGDRWPRDGLGHLGFTGTSMWLDPARERYVILLTNRVHPTRDNPLIRGFRRSVMDAVVAHLDGDRDEPAM